MPPGEVAVALRGEAEARRSGLKLPSALCSVPSPTAGHDDDGCGAAMELAASHGDARPCRPASRCCTPSQRRPWRREGGVIFPSPSLFNLHPWLPRLELELPASARARDGDEHAGRRQAHWAAARARQDGEEAHGGPMGASAELELAAAVADLGVTASRAGRRSAQRGRAELDPGVDVGGRVRRQARTSAGTDGGAAVDSAPRCLVQSEQGGRWIWRCGSESE